MDKSKIVIFFASFKEAKQLLCHSKLKFEKLHSKEYTINYKNFKIIAIITGIGKKSLLKSINNLIIEKNVFIIKAGVCAVIDSNIPLLQPIIPTTVSIKDEQINIDLDFTIEKLIYGGNLMTINKPLTNNNESDMFYRAGVSMVDMESFYIAKEYRDNRFVPIVVGTDRGGSGALIEFFKNLSAGSEKLKEAIIDFIDYFDFTKQ